MEGKHQGQEAGGRVMSASLKPGLVDILDESWVDDHHLQQARPETEMFGNLV